MFLDDLPRIKYGENERIDWKNSVGRIVEYVYDDVNGFINILDVVYKNNKTYLKIIHKGNIVEVRTDAFSNSLLGNLLDKHVKFCKYKEKNIFDLVSDNLPNWKIIKIERTKKNVCIYLKDNYGYLYDKIGIHSIRRGSIPLKFIKSNPYTIQNIKLWCKLNNKPFELISEIYKNNSEHLEWKCLKEDCGEVFQSSWGTIHNNHNCPYCTGNKTGLSNCLATKNPELAKEWHPTKNGDLTPYDITSGSGKQVWWQCKNCKNSWQTSVSTRAYYNTQCPECRDGLSYPEKFAINMFFQLKEQLKNKYIYQYSPNWLKPMRADFYFEKNNNKYVLEMDGGLGHGNTNSLNGKTEEERIKTKENDIQKDHIIKKKNITVIRIDCKKSDMDFIKNNILIKLSKIFDLSNVNWLKCHEYACSSLVKMASDLWNNETHSVEKIANKLNVARSTARHYLKQAQKINMCNYNKILSIKNGRTETGIKKRKKIIQMNFNGETIKIWNSATEAQEILNIESSNISSCCRNVYGRKSAGGFKWMYYEDYIKEQKEKDEFDESKLVFVND